MPIAIPPYRFGNPAALGGAAAFDPLSLSPALWLKDAGYFQTSGGSAAAADGDPVGEWQDQSGNGRHLTQATASKRPTLKLNIQNGRGVVRFDGTDDWLRKTGLSFAQPHVCFVVFRWSSGNYVFDGVSDPGRGSLRGGSGGVWKMYAGSDATLPASNTNWHVGSFEFNGASSKYRFDGGTETTVGSTAGTDTITGLTLGIAYDVVNGISAQDVGEYLLFATPPDAAGKADLFGYLNGRWGVY